MMVYEFDRCPTRYRLFKKGAYGTFDIEDVLTRRQTSLRTQDKQEVERLL